MANETFRFQPYGLNPTDTSAVFLVTGGNPRFLVETLRLLVAEGSTRVDATPDNVRVGNSDVVLNTSDGTSGTINPYGNNRAAGNGGATVLTAVGADTHDKGQQ